MRLYGFHLISQQVLSQAEATHKELGLQKTRLEYDLHVKTISLQIDQTKCLGSRNKYPMRLKVGNETMNLLWAKGRELYNELTFQIEASKERNANVVFHNTVHGRKDVAVVVYVGFRFILGIHSGGQSYSYKVTPLRN